MLSKARSIEASRSSYHDSNARKFEIAHRPVSPLSTWKFSTKRESPIASETCSEEHEDLLDVTFDVLDLLADDVEADGLGEGAALADSHDITDLDTEGG